MTRHFTLEYWVDDDCYVGKFNEVPGVFGQGERWSWVGGKHPGGLSHNDVRGGCAACDRCDQFEENVDRVV